jgi:2-methylcitrate dehydratase PrpD
VSDRELVFSLADYVVGATDIDEKVLDRARLFVLDIVGCMLAAVPTPAGRRIVDLVQARGALGETTTVSIYSGRRAEDTVLANSTLAHMLEYDDGHRPSDNHLGCVVVPAALAMAQETGASMRSLLEAIVIGYDVMGRVGEATLLPRRKSPFHGTGTTGVFAAAAVAGRLLDMGADRTAHAMAIAGTAAAGLRESTNSGPDCKPLHAGRAARNGIESAHLAEGGYLGPREIFEGPHGFCVAMCDSPRPNLVLDELGTRYAVLESGFKVHSTCGMLFTMLDGVVAAREKFHDAQGQPDVLRVGVPALLAHEPAFTRRHPTSAGAARFSISFAVAAAWLDGAVSPTQLTPERMAGADIAELEDRIEIVIDPEAEAIYQATCADPFFFYPAMVEIAKNGTTHRSLHTHPRGYDPEQPLTRAEVVRKFESVAAPIVGVAATREIAALVLDSTDDAAADLLARPLGTMTG